MGFFDFLRRRKQSPGSTRTPEAVLSVLIDERGVTARAAGQAERFVAWGDLTEVSIRTTSDGPFAEDVFWVLGRADMKEECVVPQGAEGADALLARLQQLPGFDNQAVIRSMGSTSDAKFLCWRRS